MKWGGAILDVCRYLGRKYGDEKNAIFANADIFIHPTTEDCFPLVLLEAMSYGLSIVTTNEGGIPDIVNDGINGLICERQNPESLANSIAMLLLDSELRKRMGGYGRKKLLEQFSEERFEERMKEGFIACLKR